MRRVVIIILACACIATPQGRPVDWPSYGGDARRTGWERSDTRITKDNVKDFQLVLKRKLEGAQAAPGSLTPPVVIGLLISYKGFKELGFVANSAGDLWSIDVDLNRLFWHKRFAGASQKTAGGSSVCTTLATVPALTPPVIFTARRRPIPAGGGTATQSPGLPPTPAGRSTERALPARLGGGGFGGPRPIYMMAGDGKLRQVNTSDGSDKFPPLDFLPANAKALSLTMNDHVIYAATTGNCGGSQDAVWAIDLAEEDPKPVSFPLTGGGPVGLGGFAAGTDGTVYAQTSNTLSALAPRDLKLKGSFSSAGKATPVVFDYKGRDLIVAAGSDGRLRLLDSESFNTALHQTAPIGSIWGGLSSWEENNVRWVAAPVWGPLNAELKAPLTNGAAPNGSIVAFRIEEQGGKPVLTPAWVSRDLSSPVPPVVTSGIVFALSTRGRAVLYALDGTTGKEVYSTGNQVTAAGSLTGLTVANGRVFFTTMDNTLYAFGIYMEI
jgi:outer membrane protein assembly factor BamB